MFLVRYFEGQLPAVFAIPAGVGDVLTGILRRSSPTGGSARSRYARPAAIGWNLFGMADVRM